MICKSNKLPLASANTFEYARNRRTGYVNNVIYIAATVKVRVCSYCLNCNIVLSIV